jgi:hypothetical protein
MKLIGRLMLWGGQGLAALCLATFLSQGVLLMMLWSRGYLTTEKVAKIQAIVAGVDYHQIRADLQQAAQTAAEDPKQLAMNELLAKQAEALGRRSSDIALNESRLRDSSRRFALQEEAFNGKVDSLETTIQQTTQGQLVRTMKNMSTDQVKANMVQIIKDGGIEDILAVVRQMTSSEQTKVFSEFQTDEEKVILNDILNLMRKKS